MVLDREVTVCNKCHMACCWLGILLCEDARSAGTIEMSIAELHKLGPIESPEYWFKNPNTGAIDRHGLSEYLQTTGASARSAVGKKSESDK